MRLICCVLMLLASLAVACGPGLSRSASPGDFDGKWVGTWSWDAKSSSTLEIVGSQLKARSLPVVQMNGSMDYVTAEGRAEFQQVYGDKGATCILVSFPRSSTSVPIYINRSKFRLVYDVETSLDRRIAFSRSSTP